MTKRPPFVVIVLVISICFLLGVLNVFIKDPQDPTPAPEIIRPTSEQVTESPIQSILIVGVDDLRNIKPKLRSVWIAAYRSTDKSVYLHGLKLNTPIQGKDGETFQSVFNFSVSDGLGSEFVEALYRTLPLAPTLTIVLDDIAFAEIVDYLGGIELHGTALDGAGVLTFLSLHWDQPVSLLTNQATVIRALIPKALDQPESPELTELFGLVPSHAFLSMDISTTVAKIYPLREIDVDSVFLILPEDMENP